MILKAAFVAKHPDWLGGDPLGDTPGDARGDTPGVQKLAALSA
jgi:hypothetical protein